MPSSIIYVISHTCRLYTRSGSPCLLGYSVAVWLSQCLGCSHWVYFLHPSSFYKYLVEQIIIHQRQPTWLYIKTQEVFFLPHIFQTLSSKIFWQTILCCNDYLCFNLLITYDKKRVWKSMRLHVQSSKLRWHVTLWGEEWKYWESKNNISWRRWYNYRLKK